VAEINQQILTWGGSMRLINIVIFIIYLSTSNAIAADIYISDLSQGRATTAKCGLHAVEIRGSIKVGDSLQLISAINRMRDNYCKDKSVAGVIVRLDSIGGDVDESIAMGRLIRKQKMITTVPSASKCYSACVFVLIGGHVRTSFGSIGIHRPYLEYIGEPLDYQKVKQIRDKRLLD